MKNKFLIIYDYYLLNDGSEHRGINGIFTSYLESKKIEYKVNKNKFNENFSNLFKKTISLWKDIKKDEFNKIFCYNLINAINAWLIKIILFKNYKIIFISPDFSKNRFNNFIKNNIYIFLDFFASIVSDEVWSCSKRVFDYRKSFLGPEKNFYIPNIPTYEHLNLKKFDRFTIVMISFLNFNYMFEEIYKIFPYIKENNIDLIIVGEGDLKSEIEKEIKQNKVEDYVSLLGYLKHDKLRELLEKSHLGLALYGGKLDYNFWGDSVKIREYTYYNLPVITTKNVYNEKEVREENIGICLEDYGGLLEAIKKIYENKLFYKSIVESIKTYNQKYQIDKIYNERLK